MSAPTLINLPPPPSDPATPSEIPGTPNSGTTSMSELSTVAIKDGHRGHPHLHHTRGKSSQQNTTSLDAERADRISRLAGLEPIATTRAASNNSLPPGASANHPDGGYFGNLVPPPSREKERSTVGSASATAETGSAGGHTTWASGGDSDQYDTATDKMSEDMETGSPTSNMSETGSLVAFGEGASSVVGEGPGSTRGSTVSGPVSSVTPAMRAAYRQSTGSRGAIGLQMPGGGGPLQPLTSFARDPRAPGEDFDSDSPMDTPPADRFDEDHDERMSGLEDRR